MQTAQTAIRPATAILTGTEIITTTGHIEEYPLINVQPECLTMGLLFDIAKAAKCRNLWILKNSDFWIALKNLIDDPASNFLQTGTWSVRAGRNYFERSEMKNAVSAFIEGETGSSRTIIFPGMFEENWAFDDDISNPYELINAIMDFETYTGVAPSFPFKCSKEIFDRSQRSRFELITNDFDDYWEPFILNTRSEIIFTRPPSDDEKDVAKNPFVSCFDKKSMFLAAARSAEFGVGPYKTVSNTLSTNLSKKAIGLVQIERPTYKPDPLSQFFASIYGNDEFFYTPFLPLLEGVSGGPIVIKNGWLWESGRRVFEKFATIVGNAKKETTGSDVASVRICNAAVKSLYTRFFGWFGRNARPISPFAAELFRPDWRGQIVSLANANLMRNVSDVYRKTGKLPIAINHDAMMYYHGLIKPETEFKGTCVLEENKFSHEWTIDADLVTAAIADERSAGEIDQLHKKAVKYGT